MLVIKTREELISFRKSVSHSSVGLVPTMGNLHKGHIELIQNSLRDNKLTVVTIFVNPTQFGEGEDLSNYPRTLEADIEKIRAIQTKNEIIIFAPSSVGEIYPDSFQTNIKISALSTPLCGKTRSGHFDGVATVVYVLFSLTRPTKAYFGKKDFQQLQIIKQMVRDLLIPVKIVPIDIVRDHDGMALSSRNSYLSQEERKDAIILKNTISKISDMIRKSNYVTVKSKIDEFVKESKKDSKWEYLEIFDSETLTIPSEKSSELLIAGAYKIGQTRLIDNQTVEITSVR